MNELGRKFLRQELTALQDELDDMTYLGNDVNYFDYKERVDEITMRMDTINKELGDD